MGIAVEEFRCGWKALLASSLGIAFGISPIPFGMLGPITPSLQEAFGWSRAQIMFAITVIGITNAVMAPLYGVLMDRTGARKIALATLVGYAVCWLAVARNTGSILVFYACWFLMAVVGSGSQPISWTRVVNSWFKRSRGVALGIALTGTGVSAFIINLLGPFLVSRFGWRYAIVGSAMLPLVVALPVAVLFFREPPETRPIPGENTCSKSVAVPAVRYLQTARFWLLFIIFFAIALAYAGLLANFVPLLVDHHFTLVTAGAVTSLIGVSIIVGRIASGYLLDSFWAPLVSAPFVASPIATCVLLTFASVSSIEASVGAVLLGLAGGVETGLLAYLTIRYYGLRSYGTLYSILFGGFGLGSAFSPPIYGWVYDTFGTYRPALWSAAGIFGAAALLLLKLGPYPQLEGIEAAASARDASGSGRWD